MGVYTPINSCSPYYVRRGLIISRINGPNFLLKRLSEGKDYIDLSVLITKKGGLKTDLKNIKKTKFRPPSATSSLEKIF